MDVSRQETIAEIPRISPAAQVGELRQAQVGVSHDARTPAKSSCQRNPRVRTRRRAREDTVGFKVDGTIGEIFLNADRANSMLDVLLSDAAILASIAIQNGASVRQLAHAIKRDGSGLASSMIGAVLDRISTPEVT
jgi:hypothetical protein